MLALKGRFQVTAGVILSEPMNEYTRIWTYTSKDYDEDQENMASTFNHMKQEAYDYAMELTNPGLVNWVRVEFYWI